MREDNNNGMSTSSIATPNTSHSCTFEPTSGACRSARCSVSTALGIKIGTVDGLRDANADLLVGTTVGTADTMLGARLSILVGAIIGTSVGVAVGGPVSLLEGLSVMSGVDDGGIVGTPVGIDVGGIIGTPVGIDVGGIVGTPVGIDVGGIVGTPVGIDVGGIVGTPVGPESNVHSSWQPIGSQSGQVISYFQARTDTKHPTLIPSLQEVIMRG